MTGHSCHLLVGDTWHLGWVQMISSQLSCFLLSHFYRINTAFNFGWLDLTWLDNWPYWLDDLSWQLTMTTEHDNWTCQKKRQWVRSDNSKAFWLPREPSTSQKTLWHGSWHGLWHKLQMCPNTSNHRLPIVVNTNTNSPRSPSRAFVRATTGELTTSLLYTNVDAKPTPEYP